MYHLLTTLVTVLLHKSFQHLVTTVLQPINQVFQIFCEPSTLCCNLDSHT